MTTFPTWIKFTLSDYGRRHLKEELPKEEEINITQCISSDFGYEVAFERDGLSGVMIEESFPQRFYKEAFDLLKDLFQKHGLYAYAKLNIYRRDKISFTDYELLKTVVLDFSTAVIYDNYIEMSSISTNLHSYIKANRKTKYDIPVREICEKMTQVINENGKEKEVEVNKPWIYGRVPLYYDVLYTMSINHRSRERHIYIPLVPGTVPTRYGRTKHEFRAQEEAYEYSDTNYFFKAYEDEPALKLEMKFKLKVTGRAEQVHVDLIYGAGSASTIQRVYDLNGEAVLDVDYTYESSRVFAKDRTLALRVYFMNGVDYRTVELEEFTEFRITYIAQAEPLVIDIIRPDDLLNYLCRQITDNKNDFSASIEWESSDKSIRLCAAESLRNYKEAILHTSLDNFINWMEVLGYGYECNDTSLTFKRYTEFFPRLSFPLTLKEDECSDLIIKADPDFAYTGLKIGYEPQEYESANGRFEVNGTFDYSTGYISEQENVLELISPYRADPIGIELLCWERPEDGKESTDTRSDNDVFMIYLFDTGTSYKEGSYSMLCVGEVKMFNYELSPYRLVNRHSSRIGIISNRIYFTGTTSNREAKIIINNTVSDGLYNDIPIGSYMFKPFIYNIACRNNTLLPGVETNNGMIRFTYNGKTYNGYLKRATKNFSRETETTLTLHAF